jgi:predicted metal-binding membrane protein
MSEARSLPGTTALPRVVPGAIALAWLVVVGAQLLGAADAVHHDALIEGRLPLWAAFVVFVLAWQSMTAAMMLPSSLPMIRLFHATARAQPGRGTVTALFLGAYGVVWAGFGAAAFIADVMLHRLSDSSPWLQSRPWIVPALVLAFAGAFQFSSLKERCLRECRHPGAFLLQHYRRGNRAAFELGLRHGLFCLGCCWALMLVMVAVGAANLTWMALLTAVMVYEKTGRLSREVGHAVGFGLLFVAAVVAINQSGF